MEVIYKSYTDSQKKAIYKYRNEHKDKINSLAKKYYDQKKDDPEYVQKKRDACKRSYEKRKLVKQKKISLDEFDICFLE